MIGPNIEGASKNIWGDHWRVLGRARRQRRRREGREHGHLHLEHLRLLDRRAFTQPVQTDRVFRRRAGGVANYGRFADFTVQPLSVQILQVEPTR